MAKNSDKSYVMTSLLFIELLKKNNLKDGMISALNVIRYYLDADNVSILKEKNGYYNVILHDCDKIQGSTIDKEQTEKAINSDKSILKSGCYKLFKENENPIKNNSFFYNINFDGKNYILSATNIKNKCDLIDYLNKLLVIFPLIIKTCIEQEKKQFEDELTHLGNRAKFNKKLQAIDKSDKTYIIGLFDLFRLKYINDNFSHNDGDDYIINCANILKETFGAIPGRTSIYRVGGDEFVVVTEGDNIELFKTLAEMCSEKTKQLAFGKINNIPLDMNYGIHLREGKESGKGMCYKADKELQEQKTEEYKALGLDRRR